MRSILAVIAASSLLLVPSLASAQDDPDCPPGGWFCEETEPADVGDVEPEDVDEPPSKKPRKSTPPPIVVYEPQEDGSRKITIIDKTDEKPRRPKRRRARPEWGFNMHLQGVLMGGSSRTEDRQARHPDASMGGLGFSFRYRPIPHFALDAGLDFIGGVDYQGNDRGETALLLNAMAYFNPKDKAQIYVLGGLGFSGATVNKKTELTLSDNSVALVEEQKEYRYFGGQVGVGLEFRVAKKTALNLDVIGFVRGRTDDQARFEPEFTDPETGRTTNTSGGGLFRGGITFYW